MTTDPLQTPLSENTPTTESPISESETDISQTAHNGSTYDDQSEIIRQLQDQLARAQADYANLVRRSREESLQIGQWTEEKTILKFLPILDNLERALEHIPSELTDNTWVE